MILRQFPKRYFLNATTSQTTIYQRQFPNRHFLNQTSSQCDIFATDMFPTTTFSQSTFSQQDIFPTDIFPPVIFPTDIFSNIATVSQPTFSQISRQFPNRHFLKYCIATVSQKKNKRTTFSQSDSFPLSEIPKTNVRSRNLCFHLLPLLHFFLYKKQIYKKLGLSLTKY